MRRYPSIVIVLHWAMALLILVAYLTSEGGPHVRTNPPTLHFWLGMSVLALFVPRFISRLVRGGPPADNSHGQLLALAARAGHWALYGLILFVPLSGWYAASRLGVAVSLLGFQLPSIAVDGAPGFLAELHQLGGNAILLLAGLHALMALWHQFVLKDGTLSRMLPSLRLNNSE